MRKPHFGPSQISRQCTRLDCQKPHVRDAHSFDNLMISGTCARISVTRVHMREGPISHWIHKVAVQNAIDKWLVLQLIRNIHLKVDCWQMQVPYTCVAHIGSAEPFTGLRDFKEENRRFSDRGHRYVRKVGETNRQRKSEISDRGTQ